MDGLETIGAKISNFPGYGTLEARRSSDELVRSYAGEALASLDELHPEFFAERSDAYESLSLRLGFMNQVAFHAFEYAAQSDARRAAVAQADSALVAVADRAAQVALAAVPAYLDDMTAALDARDAAMKGA